MKPAFFLIAVLATVLTASYCQEEELPLHKACLMECFRCVKTYGKQVYKGKLCAENCAESNGLSIDANCDSPIKRSFNKPAFTSKCAQQCSHKCGQNSVHANGCMFTCVLSSEKIIVC